MKNWIALGVLLFILVTSAPAPAENEEYKKVTAPEVKDMLDGGRAVAVHVLSRIEFEMQHITGSINIPINEMNETDKLPKQRDTPLIFYCMGLK
jgi:rhodanese-related sulfurtransferase